MKESSEHQGAALLLKVAGIVSKEIDSDGIDWEDDLRSDPPPLSLVETENIYLKSVAHTKDSDTADSRPRTSFLSLSRIRSVSIDLSEPEETSSREGSPDLGFSLGAPIVSPLNSPVNSRRTPRRKSGIKALMLNKHSEMPTKKMVEAKGTLNGHTLKTILRKKFSWKNYPEVSSKNSCEVLTSTSDTRNSQISFNFSIFSWKHFSLPTGKNIFVTLLLTTLFNKSSTTTS